MNGNSFVFFFKDGKATKVPHKNSGEIYQDSAYLLIFGYAFKIDEYCNVNTNSFTYFDGDNYYYPEGTNSGDSAAQAVVGLPYGTHNFQCANMETWFVK